MQPQNTSPTNPAYIAALVKQLDAVTAETPCSEVQALVDQSFASLQAYSSAITQQMALLQPMLALLNVPGNPAAVVTWVGNFISSFLTPYLKPYITYGLQLTQLAADVASLSTAINNAAARIESCTINIPPIV